MSVQPPDFNELWDYGDPAGTETKFRAILSEYDGKLDAFYELELLTQIARTHSLRGSFAEAHRILDVVLARMPKRSRIEVRYLLERGRAHNSAGDAHEAVSLFKRALAVGQTVNEPFYVVDALHMLGIAAPPDERKEWNLKAISFAEKASDRKTQGWLGSLYNNLGWTLFDEGQFDQALELFQKCYAHFDSEDRPDRAGIAKWSMGKALRSMGKLDEALELQRELENSPQHDGFVDEEIAECLYELGQHDQAKPYFAKAFAQLSQIDWVAKDIGRMERLKALGG